MTEKKKWYHYPISFYHSYKPGKNGNIIVPLLRKLMVPFHPGYIMVPFRERRHRIQGPELRPVAESVRERLGRLVANRTSFEEACLLFRVLYRLDCDGPGRPCYPDEEWTAIEVYLWERRGPPT